MGIGVKIDLNQTAITRIVKAVAPAAEKTIDALRTDVMVAQVMPFDTGDMQNNQTFTVTESDADGVTARLVTGSPQSRRLYYHPEYHFQKGNNPNAGGLWLEPWTSGERKNFVQDAFAENYKKEAGI